MGKIIRRFFIWSFSGLIVILVIWLVVGNLIAAQQEKKIDEAKEQFRKQFPKIEANNSALKLEELTAKLGISVNQGLRTTSTRYLNSFGSEVKAKEFENIRKQLDNYLNAQLEKPTDEIDIPPDKLRQYLSSNASVLEIVQNHVLNSEVPQWDNVELTNFTASDASPSFLGLVNFQKILTINILEKTRLGQNQEALKSLEVSDKLQQSIVKNPDIIAQLVAIIIACYSIFSILPEKETDGHAAWAVPLSGERVPLDQSGVDVASEQIESILCAAFIDDRVSNSGNRT